MGQPIVARCLRARAERISLMVVTLPGGTLLMSRSTSTGAGMATVPCPHLALILGVILTTRGKSLLSASFSRHEVCLVILGKDRPWAMCRDSLRATSPVLPIHQHILHDNPCIRKAKTNSVQKKRSAMITFCSLRRSPRTVKSDGAGEGPGEQGVDDCRVPGRATIPEARGNRAHWAPDGRQPARRQPGPKSCARYSVGDWPSVFLKTRLKCVRD